MTKHGYGTVIKTLGLSQVAAAKVHSSPSPDTPRSASLSSRLRDGRAPAIAIIVGGMELGRLALLLLFLDQEP
jgi:hypothetical protein